MSKAAPKSMEFYLPLFYEDPVEEVDIYDLEIMTKRRVEILRSAEFNIREKSKISHINGDFLYNLKLTSEQKQLQDQVSFFMCKLAYCNHSEEAKQWVTNETALFKIRMNERHPTEVLKQANIQFEIVNVQNIDYPIPEDRSALEKINDYGNRYKVPLSLSACLLRMNYFPIRGYCYVTEEHLKEVVANLFRSGLELSLREAQKHQITDDRIKAIISRVNNPDADNSYKAKDSKDRVVNLENMEMVAHNHFPPCMKKLFSSLKQNHHLKHFGRLQFGLFLKGVGLPLDDALRF